MLRFSQTFHQILQLLVVGISAPYNPSCEALLFAKDLTKKYRQVREKGKPRYFLTLKPWSPYKTRIYFGTQKYNV